MIYTRLDMTFALLGDANLRDKFLDVMRGHAAVKGTLYPDTFLVPPWVYSVFEILAEGEVVQLYGVPLVPHDSDSFSSR